MTHPTIEMPLTLAMEAFAAVINHVGTDDVMPILTGVCIRGGKLIATDRYTVGSFDIGIEPDGGSILLPRAAAAWIATTVRKNLPSDAYGQVGQVRVRITSPVPDGDTKQPVGRSATGDDLIVVELISERYGIEARRVFWPVYGNFPNMEKLMAEFVPGEEVATVALKPELIERFTRYAKKYEPHESLNFTLGKGSNPKLPGVVKITIGKFVGLLQPNLILR